MALYLNRYVDYHVSYKLFLGSSQYYKKDILDVLCMIPDEMRMEQIRDAGERISKEIRGRSPIRGAWSNHGWRSIGSRRDAIKNICFRC